MHFTCAFDDEVNLLLLLVVPRNLSAVGLESHVAHGECAGLNGAGSADQVLCSAPCRVGTAGDLGKIGNNHML